MKQTPDEIIKNIGWIIRGSEKERDTLAGNLKTMWDIDTEKIDVNFDHHLFI